MMEKHKERLVQKIVKTDKYGRIAESDEGYHFIEWTEARAGKDEFFDYTSNKWMVCAAPWPDVIYRRLNIGVTNKQEQKSISVSRDQFKQILGVICSDWRIKLAKQYSDFSYVDTMTIDISVITEYLKSVDTPAQTAKIKAILKIEEEFKVGELVLCKIQTTSTTFELRFYAGNGSVYSDQQKSGSTLNPVTILKLDLKNLPPELRNEPN